MTVNDSEENSNKKKRAKTRKSERGTEMKSRKGSIELNLPEILFIAFICAGAVFIILSLRKSQVETPKSGAITQGEASKVTAVQTEMPSEVVQREGYRIEYYLDAGLARIIVPQSKYDKTLGISCSEEILQAYLEIRKEYSTSDPLQISTVTGHSSLTRVVIVSIAPRIGGEQGGTR